MADNDSATKTEMKYYRSRISGLEIVVGEPDREAGEIAHQTVRFTPYRETFKGDGVRIGYLATDNPIAQAKLGSDSNVTELTKKEYDQATTSEDSEELAH